VRNTATNAVRKVETSAAGIYTVTELVVGPYEVTVEKDGFKPVKYQALTLTVDQALTINARLQVGSNAEQVTVEGGQVASINTTDAQGMQSLAQMHWSYWGWRSVLSREGYERDRAGSPLRKNAYRKDYCLLCCAVFWRLS